MPVPNMKYCEYFDVDEKYFPCIDESAINSGAAWNDTFPHNTFIELLNLTEKMLSGTTNRSIWVHGAYGTGKSKCAYALKKILEVPEEEVRAYWDKLAIEKVPGTPSETRWAQNTGNRCSISLRFGQHYISPAAVFCSARECKESLRGKTRCLSGREHTERKCYCLA